MQSKHSFMLAALAAAMTTSLSGVSQARHAAAAQLCSLGTSAVGQPGTLICKNVVTGAITQSIPLGATVSAAGGIARSLVSQGDRVLVTNQAGGAVLLRSFFGRLVAPALLDTNGKGTLSGALNERGAYVLTATSLEFFPNGQSKASSSRPLLVGDGSAATVTLTDRYAYVSEKAGSLEAFPLARDGSLAGPATSVRGVSPGTIVGITSNDAWVFAPIAHLASNFAQAELSVVGGLSQAQLVPTKEVAACWAANDDGEVCVTNPGSMTVSCGHVGRSGLDSYTSAAATLGGDAAFDIDMRNDLVGMQTVRAGVPMLLTYARGDGDFLSFVSEFPVGTTSAAGALLLEPISR